MALIGRGRLRLLPLAATVQPKVSSPALRAFLAEQETPVCTVLHFVSAHHPFGKPNGALSACIGSSSCLKSAIEAANERGFDQTKEKYHG